MDKVYRIESFSGSGERNLENVISFEIGELGNDDIIDYVQKNYRILRKYDLDHDNIIEIIWDELSIIVNKITEFVAEKLGTKDLICIWLTDLDGLADNYADNDRDWVSKYHLPQSHCILSDLSDQGILVACKEDEIYIEDENELVEFKKMSK